MFGVIQEAKMVYYYTPEYLVDGLYPENTNYEENIEYLLHFNFIDWIWKCLYQSEAEADILIDRSAPKNANLIENIEYLLPLRFCQI